MLTLFNKLYINTMSISITIYIINKDAKMSQVFDNVYL